MQPLAGEWAVRRSALEQLPTPTGYGVDLAAMANGVIVVVDRRCGFRSGGGTFRCGRLRPTVASPNGETSS